MSASRRTNVLLISVDHWPGVFRPAPGRLQTQTLDRLASAGTRFVRAYSECPVCIPARRTLMTGTSPRVHGDRTFQTHLRMPALPTLARCFREAGYQCFAVGKLHVYPPRDRIGFDDVILAEEGRPQYGWLDDYDIALGDAGFPGRQFLHGMSNNDYAVRTWHLPEALHVTNWLTEQMCRTIRRRDPTRPAFWYLSYTHPHPPLVPLPFYWDLYADVRDGRTAVLEPWNPRDVGGAPSRSESGGDSVEEPSLVRELRAAGPSGLEEPLAYRTAIAGFMALCTHIDHQLRLVLGTLREEGILQRTAILFTSDHGDMLGWRGLWGKRVLYEPSINVPMLLVLPRNDPRSAPGTVDRRLV
ncbi:MAG: arylsulfatase, partial [Planctomycetota bacterium]